MAHEPRSGVRLQKKWRDRLIRWVRAAPDRRAGVYLDESWFVCWPHPAPQWAPQRRPARLPKAKSWPKGQRPESTCLYATMEVGMRTVASAWHATWNQDETWTALERVLTHYAKRHIRSLVIFWDNAPWHVAWRLRERVAQHNRQAKTDGGVHVLLFALPVRSPWLMPLEAVFGQTKRAVGPRLRQTVTELQQAVERRLTERNTWVTTGRRHQQATSLDPA